MQTLFSIYLVEPVTAVQVKPTSQIYSYKSCTDKMDVSILPSPKSKSNNTPFLEVKASLEKKIKA